MKKREQMFLVDIVFTDVDKITAELTAKHSAYIEREYEKNNLVFGGRKIPRSGGIIVSQHETRAALERCLALDPFVENGAVSYSITEFMPVMASQDYINILT